MKYDKAELYEKAMKHATDKEKMLIFVEDLCAYMGISKPTYYTYFPPDSDEFNEIKAALEDNKIQIKVSLRSKWHKSNNPTTQICLYRLLSTPEEHAKLNNTNNTSQPDKDKDKLNPVGFEFKIAEEE